MKPLAVFSSLAVLCAGGLLALSYQGWQDEPSVVTAMSDATQQTVSAGAGQAAPEQPSGTPATKPETEAAEQTAAVQPDTAATQQQPPAEAASQEQPAATAATAPTFDIVRLEEDGSAVLAGRAEPNSTVTAMLNGEPVGEAVTNERGEWVILPSSPLPAGAHELTLSQSGADGAKTASDQSVALTVPDQPGSQPLIVLSEAAKPSRVLQKPESATKTDTEAKPAAEVKQETAEVAKPEPAQETVAAVEPSQTQETTEAASEQQPAGAASTAAAPAVEPAQPASEPASPAAAPTQRSLTVDVVDYDDQGRTTFSGKAAPGSRVRLYVSGRFTGETAADASGSWSITPSREIEAGQHALRADLLSDGGNVAERIELPFLRESPERIAGLQADRNAKSATSEPAQEQAGQPVETAQQPATGSAQTQAGAESQAQPAEPVEQKTATDEVKQQEEAATAGAADAAQQPQGPGRVVIQPGNNLWQISRVIYGKGVQYTVIYEANKDQIRDPDLIYPGQILDTPGANAPESIDPSCRKPLAECSEQEKGAAQ